MTLVFISPPSPDPGPIEKSRRNKILDIAGEGSPLMQAAFLRAIAETRGRIVLAEVTRALERADLAAAWAAIPWTDVGESILLDALPSRYRDIYEAAARQAAAELAGVLGTAVRFDLLNPRAVDWIRQNAASQIRQFGAATERGIRALILRAFEDGIPPARLARMIRDTGIGLLGRQVRAVENARARLEESGELTAAKIDARMERLSRRYLHQRTEMIARTESLRASNEGQRELWREAAEQGLLGPGTTMEWVATLDDRVDPVCEALDGVTVLLGSLFPGGFAGPPDPHPDCRCTLVIHPR